MQKTELTNLSLDCGLANEGFPQTRVLNLFSKRKLPPAFFDVLYLDDELRVHRTGQNATFVQRRPAWVAA